MEEKILFTLVGFCVSGAGFYVTTKVQIAILKEKVDYLSEGYRELKLKIFGDTSKSSEGNSANANYRKG